MAACMSKSFRADAVVAMPVVAPPSATLHVKGVADPVVAPPPPPPPVVASLSGIPSTVVPDADWDVKAYVVQAVTVRGMDLQHASRRLCDDLEGR